MPPQQSPVVVFDSLQPHPPKKAKKYQKTVKKTVPYSSAPAYLKFNPFITDGYRVALSWGECVGTLPHWTNETVNIYTHFFGWLVFFSLTVRELVLFEGEDFAPQFVRVGVLVCFQACMLLSSLYHTFCCSSESCYRGWLRADLLGVSFALLAIYLSGIYFAFGCDVDKFWLNFHLSTVALFFLIAVGAQFAGGGNKDEVGLSSYRLTLFGGWAAYGVLPTLQWVVMRQQSFFNVLNSIQGQQWGSDNGDIVDIEVKTLLPRILIMYIISSLAFFFYVSRIPERLSPGSFNYAFSSHNLWHVLIFTALYYWYSVVVLEHSTTSCPAYN